MRQLMILLVTLLLTLPLKAQFWSVGLRAGLGQYSMQDLDDLQEFRRNEAGLPLQTTESYPIAPNYRFEIACNDKGTLNRYGIFYTFNTTGARSTVSDYSGRFDLDAVIIGNQTGLTYDRILNKKEFPEYGLYAEAGYLWTRLKTTDHFHLIYPDEYTQEESHRFKANGLSFEFGLFIQHSFRYFRARMNFGYLLGYSGKLYLLNDKSLWLFVDNKSLKPQWNGLRLGLQLDLFTGKERLK